MTDEGLGKRDEIFADGEEPISGVSDLVAIALVLLDLEFVYRTTLQALCLSGLEPRPSNKGDRNRAAFSRSLRTFERHGRLRREPSPDGDQIIRVLDREGLRAWVTMGKGRREERAAAQLDLIATVQRLNRAADDDEQRNRELHAVQRIMEASPSRTPGRTGARVVPRSNPL